jgi:hypothetical protein
MDTEYVKGCPTVPLRGDTDAFTEGSVEEYKAPAEKINTRIKMILLIISITLF